MIIYHLNIMKHLLQLVEEKFFYLKKNLLKANQMLKNLLNVKKFLEKRHKNISCHCSPCFTIKEGDIVIAG